jgi:hypothetical protein
MPLPDSARRLPSSNCVFHTASSTTTARRRPLPPIAHCPLPIAHCPPTSLPLDDIPIPDRASCDAPPAHQTPIATSHGHARGVVRGPLHLPMARRCHTMPVSVAPLIACPPSRLPMAQCPWPNANAAPLRRWHVKDGRHEAPFPIPIPSHSALPLLILSLLRGPAITIAIAIAIPLYTHTHTHTTPHHTTSHPHPLPHPSVSFLFAPAAAAVRFSLPTPTNHLPPMLPAVPLNRRDGVCLLSSVVP